VAPLGLLTSSLGLGILLARGTWAFKLSRDRRARHLAAETAARNKTLQPIIQELDHELNSL
jgi:hypothetical protein